MESESNSEEGHYSIEEAREEPLPAIIKHSSEYTKWSSWIDLHMDITWGIAITAFLYPLYTLHAKTKLNSSKTQACTCTCTQCATVLNT